MTHIFWTFNEGTLLIWTPHVWTTMTVGLPPYVDLG
jgi:hypothetical protein